MAHATCITRASSILRASPLVPEHAPSRSQNVVPVINRLETPKTTVPLSHPPRTPAPRAAIFAAIPAASLLAALPASAAAALAEESPATDKVRSAVGSLLTAAEDLERAAASTAGVDKARSAVGSLVSAAEDLKRAAVSAYRDVAGAGSAGGDTAQFDSAVGDIVSATGDLERAAVGIFGKAVSAEESVSEQVGKLLGSGVEATQKLLESSGEALQADTAGVTRMIGDAASAGLEAVERLFQEGAPALDGVWSDDRLGDAAGAGMVAVERLFGVVAPALDGGVWSADTVGVARMIGGAGGAGMEAIEQLLGEGAPALDGSMDGILTVREWEIGWLGRWLVDGGAAAGGDLEGTGEGAPSRVGWFRGWDFDAMAAAAAAASTTLPRNGCLSATQTAALSSSRVTRNHGLLASLRSSRSLHSQFQSRRPATTFRKQLITKTSRSSTVRCSFHESQMGQPDAISDFEKSISDAELQGMVDESLVWSSLNGLVVGDQTVEDSGSVPGSGLIPAPVTLLPTPFPAHHFHRAMELAPLFNALVDAVSQDSDFLQSTLTRPGFVASDAAPHALPSTPFLSSCGARPSLQRSCGRCQSGRRVVTALAWSLRQ
ncbi:unnamed protein product [Closterium sp. NIES-54]